MKAIKYLIYFIVVMATGLFVSCNDDAEYNPASVPAGEQAYFDVEMTSTVLIENNQNSISIPVYRASSKGAYTAQVKATTEAGFLTIPSTVTFADGSKVANIVITYPFSSVVAETPYAVALSLSDVDNTTEYGRSAISFSILFSPWTTVKAEKDGKELTEGQYTDDLITAIFSVEIADWSVTIQESDITPGMYRIVNPYTFYCENLFNVGAPYDNNLIIDATNPNAVVIPEQEMGMTNKTYGKFLIKTLQPGTLKNGVITFPVEGLVLGLSNYNSGKFLFKGNASGGFKIVFPGADGSDPATTAMSYVGTYTDIDGIVSPVVNFKFNKQAKSCKYAVVAGDITANDEEIATTATGIKNGSIESIEVTESGYQALKLDAGAYTAIAVSYDKDGVVGATSTLAFEFTTGPVPTLADYLGTWTISATIYANKQESTSSWNDVVLADGGVDKEGNQLVNISGLMAKPYRTAYPTIDDTFSAVFLPKRGVILISAESSWTADAVIGSTTYWMLCNPCNGDSGDAADELILSVKDKVISFKSSSSDTSGVVADGYVFYLVNTSTQQIAGTLGYVWNATMVPTVAPAPASAVAKVQSAYAVPFVSSKVFQKSAKKSSSVKIVSCTGKTLSASATINKVNNVGKLELK